MLELEFGVEHHAHVRAHPLAVINRNRLARGISIPAGRARRPVDDDSQQPAQRLSPELHVENIEPEVAGNPLRDGPNLRNPAFTGLHPVFTPPLPCNCALKHKEVGETPTSAGLRLS